MTTRVRTPPKFDFWRRLKEISGGKPGPIAFPDPRDVAETIKKIQVIDLITMVQLKLAARRYQDLADVVSLIAANNLDEAFAKNLHTSVRRDYIECLEEKRREEQYES